MPARRIDLNADLGESFGIYTLGDDRSLLPSLTSANIAAGFHAGDPSVIRQTIRLARSHGVAIGAHPAFPDLAGFGRRDMGMAPNDVEDAVLYQIASVAGIARAEGTSIQHVKPHGALYNLACRDERLAQAVVRALTAYDARLLLYAPPGSALARAGHQAGIAVIREGFVDRAYEGDGRLRSREAAGAMILDNQTVSERAVGLALRGSVMSIDGSPVPLAVDTLCIHGDAPGAASRAAHVRRALEAAGIEVRAAGGH